LYYMIFKKREKSKAMDDNTFFELSKTVNFSYRPDSWLLKKMRSVGIRLMG